MWRRSCDVVLVDFVADTEQVELLAYAGNDVELSPGIHLAGRICRGTNHNGFQRKLLTSLECETACAQLLGIELQVGATQRHNFCNSAKLLRNAQVVRIERLEKQNRSSAQISLCNRDERAGSPGRD